MPVSDIRKATILNPVLWLWVWSLPCVIFVVLGWLELATRQGYLVCPDFASFWVGAKMLLEGGLSNIYRLSGFMEGVQRFFPGDDHERAFSYPPHMLLLVSGLGFLPYYAALTLWSLAGTAGLFASLRANTFRKLDAASLALAVFSPAALFSLGSGQNGAFTAALFLGGLYLSETAPVAGGVLLGLLTVKPQLGILVPFVLLLRRNWRCIACAGATAAGLVAATVLLWGIAPWHDWITVTLPFQTSFLHGDAKSIAALIMPGPYADASYVLKMTHPGLFYAPAAAAAFFAALGAVRYDGLSARSVLAVALATLIITPYGYSYDMPAIMGALVVYLATQDRIGLPQYAVFGLLWILPTVLFVLKRFPLPLDSLIMMLALACLHEA